MSTSKKPLAAGDAAGHDRRFLALLDAVREDAVAATRHYRRRELHRGRAACRVNLCDECEQDVLLTVFEVFSRHERAKAAGRATRHAAVADAVLARAQGHDAHVDVGLLRSLLANAGKDARIKLRTATGRAAKPEQAPLTRQDFQPLRDEPLLLETLLVLLRFANSNSRLTRTVLPYDKLANQVSERLTARGLAAHVSEHELRTLLPRAVDAAEAIDPDWVDANVSGPLSERMTELVLPEDAQIDDRLRNGAVTFGLRSA
jgi:hypothetical protein